MRFYWLLILFGMTLCSTGVVAQFDDGGLYDNYTDFQACQDYLDGDENIEGERWDIDFGNCLDRWPEKNWEPRSPVWGRRNRQPSPREGPRDRQKWRLLLKTIRAQSPSLTLPSFSLTLIGKKGACSGRGWTGPATWRVKQGPGSSIEKPRLATGWCLFSARHQMAIRYDLVDLIDYLF